jgi:gluconate 2-dehydrogenase alpha chain
MATEKTDVVIVGVGGAGGILAAELSRAGMRVIGLERGPRLKTADFEPHDELRYFQRQDLRPNWKKQPVTWRANGTRRAVPMQTLNYGAQAGGGTVHYGALSWRLHEDDFRARSNTIAHYGASAIPEDSSLIDWPLTYADLEPYYDRAEYELGVSGKAGNLKGTKIAGGNVFEAPRQREYPLPALIADRSGLIFNEAATKLGYHPFSSPRAILSQAYKGRAGCTYCGFCQAFGCHVGAKSSILVTALPQADATGNFKLLTGAMCYRVNSDNSGRATGVAYYGPDGSDNTIEADLVILAPFTYDNTRLLLLSKTAKFPDGLANSSGHVGKHFMTHIRSRIQIAFDDQYVNVYMGPSAQKHSIDEFNADNFDHGGLGFIRGAQISVSPVALEGGPIGATTMNPPPGTRSWGAAYRDFFAKYYARHAAIAAQIEDLPYPHQTIDLDPDVRDQWGLPAPRVTYDSRRPNELARTEFMTRKMEEIGRATGASLVWRAPETGGGPGGHHMGGTRMGSDPKTSVVNRYSQSWDVPNLFIVGSSTFPTMGSGFNPTLTIQALAYLTSDAIVNRYRKNPGPLA